MRKRDLDNYKKRIDAVMRNNRLTDDELTTLATIGMTMRVKALSLKKSDEERAEFIKYKNSAEWKESISHRQRNKWAKVVGTMDTQSI
jgi:hypothetical protein